ncbi:MAG: PepSY domain-containing protein [Peptostreptococcus sp.]|uniref:PepSY domain-containing protein n=1 Tax=Peptostreptococcus sp. TaxID=1262 RepID=UPI001CB2E7D7|nr:PepSY domain-containing protein [Peptostreptococcus sp.]MBF1045032.1 PepSY domain-containing protein [Peptostreptococcus sp.]
MIISKNNNRKKIEKKLLVFSMCSILAISLVGCGSKNAGDGDKNKASGPSLVNELKSEKLIGLQAALLKFTTAEKAGSVASVSLEEKEIPVKTEKQDEAEEAKTEKKYIYTLEVISKKGLSQTMTIDAKTGDILSKTENGPASADLKANLLDFVPVMDVDEAAQLAAKASTKNYTQVLSYKLFAKNGMNVFSFKLYDGDVKNTETVLVDAISGKILTKADLEASQTSSTDKTTSTSSSDTTGASDNTTSTTSQE